MFLPQNPTSPCFREVIHSERRFPVLLMALLWLFLASSLSAAPRWYSSLDRALQDSRTNNRPVYLHIYADWCPVCRRMERTVYPDPSVAPELEKFVKVRVNGENNSEIAERFGVRGFPTLVFMDKNGYVINRISGGMDTGSFRNELAATRKESDGMEDRILAAVKNKKDADAYFQAGLYYAGTGDQEKGRSFFLKAWTAPGSKDPRVREDAIYNAAVSSMDLEDYVAATSHWNAYLGIHTLEDNRYVQARFYRGVSLSRIPLAYPARVDLEYARKNSSDPAIRNAALSLLKRLD